MSRRSVRVVLWCPPSRLLTPAQIICRCGRPLCLSPLHISLFSFLCLRLTVYDLVQVTKDYRLSRVSGPLTYNDITTASSEGTRDIWTDRERGWDEAEAIDTGQNRARVQPSKLKQRFICYWRRVHFWLELSRNGFTSAALIKFKK